MIRKTLKQPSHEPPFWVHEASDLLNSPWALFTLLRNLEQLGFRLELSLRDGITLTIRKEDKRAHYDFTMVR